MRALVSPGVPWKGWLVTQAGPLLTYEAHTVVCSCFLAVPPIHTPCVHVPHRHVYTHTHSCLPHGCTCVTHARTPHMCTPHMLYTFTCVCITCMCALCVCCIHACTHLVCARRAWCSHHTHVCAPHACMHASLAHHIYTHGFLLCEPSLPTSRRPGPGRGFIRPCPKSREKERSCLLSHLENPREKGTNVQSPRLPARATQRPLAPPVGALSHLKPSLCSEQWPSRFNVQTSKMTFEVKFFQ